MMEQPALRHRLLLLCCLFLLQGRSSHGFTLPAVLPGSSHSWSTSTTPVKSTASDSEAAQKLLERAQLLRQEADALETQLRLERPAAVANRPAAAREAPAVTYNKIDDSVWKLTYRFANQPINRNDDEEDDNSNDDYVYIRITWNS